MNLPTKRPLVYLITEGKATAENFVETRGQILEVIAAAIGAGVSLIQIREKKLTARLVFELTRDAVALNAAGNTKILVNDRADIALAAVADGVHLTSVSLSVATIRSSFFKDFLIGVSTHSLADVERARADGADFALFGPVLKTPGKETLVGLEELQRVCGIAELFPVLAVGGIDETNYRVVLETGAAGFAAIRFLNQPENLKKLDSDTFGGLSSKGDCRTMNKSKIQNPKSKIPRVCLTIAGLDPSGGAGIIADIKTFSAFGCFAAAAVSSITFQNTVGVFGTEGQSPETVRRQVEPVIEDFEIAALKTGMLPTRDVIEEVARLIRVNNLKNVVVDPVVRSTTGFDLIDDNALQALVENLFPLADVVTPNIPEAERISRMKIENEDDIDKAARAIQLLGAKNVLMKGGHFDAAERKAKDFLFLDDECHIFEAEYFDTTSTHGTGCTLAAAIAANLALGKNLVEAVKIAKEFVNEAIRSAPNLGRGHSPINIRPISR